MKCRKKTSQLRFQARGVAQEHRCQSSRACQLIAKRSDPVDLQRERIRSEDHLEYPSVTRLLGEGRLGRSFAGVVTTSQQDLRLKHRQYPKTTALLNRYRSTGTQSYGKDSEGNVGM